MNRNGSCFRTLPPSAQREQLLRLNEQSLAILQRSRFNVLGELDRLRQLGF